MNDNREHMWQAYIDGELTATEMARFEASLSIEEQQQLVSDTQFDRGLSERLAEDAACPDDVWERTKALLVEASASDETTVSFPARSKPRSMFWGMATLAAAAGLAFVLSTFAPGGTGLNDMPIILEAATVDELAQKSQVDANPKAIEEFMHANDIDLDLLPESSMTMAAVHAPIKLVGAGISDNGEYIELYAGCCKEPVKILLVHRDSEAAKCIGQACGNGNDLQATRIVGDYLAAVVGKHPAHDILDIFAGQQP